MKRFILATVTAALIGLPAALFAQEEEAAPAPTGPDAGQETQRAFDEATTLDALLRVIIERNKGERRENRQREAEFKAARDNQQTLLNRAKATLAREEARSVRLETAFNENEQRVTALEIQLRDRLGALGELFGHVRSVSGDAGGIVGDSLVTLQYRERENLLRDLADSKKLPSIAKLRGLWEILQQEATESGKVVRFQTMVVVGSEQVQKDVVRIGVFNAVADGYYLEHDREKQNLIQLAKQPAGQHTGTIDDLEDAEAGLIGFSVDPSRGQILKLLVDVPGFFERIKFGGFIGYTIIFMALLGIAIAIGQWINLFLVNQRVRAQLDSDRPSSDNPLGRVLSVFDANREEDVETLELKLDQAVLKETPPLERFLTMIRVFSVVAPLMGLLGTVTGMIRTFQVITLFGTGDPKLMAGGISEALVTTMLGLYAAIPLTLLHSFMAGQSKKTLHILDEQSAGIIARQAEAKEKSRAA